MYEDIQQLRHKQRDITRKIDELEHAGQKIAARDLDMSLQETTKLLAEKSEERQQKS